MEEPNTEVTGSPEDPARKRQKSSVYTHKVKDFLESVFAVSTYPEEYVKYRLHLATGLEVKQINNWFHNRRQKQRRQSIPQTETSVEQPAGAVIGLPVMQTQGVVHWQPNLTGGPCFDYGQQISMEQVVTGPQAAQNSVPMMAAPFPRPMDAVAGVMALPSSAALQAIGMAEEALPASSATPEETNPGTGATGGDSADYEDGIASEGRLVLADLDLIGKLVGLKTVRSIEEHNGFRTLYLFEQVTYLDTNWPDAPLEPGKRKPRARHAHFWRNSDKFPKEDRVYVASKDIKLALDTGHPVAPRMELAATERTNAYTVCLTPAGVVGFLNKRISPLGVRLLRSLIMLVGAKREEIGWGGAGNEEGSGPRGDNGLPEGREAEGSPGGPDPKYREDVAAAMALLGPSRAAGLPGGLNEVEAAGGRTQQDESPKRTVGDGV